MNISDGDNLWVVAPALLIGVMLAGCNGGTSSGQSPPDDEELSLKQKLDRRAKSRPPKASASIGTIHHHAGAFAKGDAGGDGDATTLGTEGPNGATIEVRGAYLVMSAVELHACEAGDPGYTPSEDPTLLNGLYDVLVPPARAHVPSSATRLGTPVVESLLVRPDRASIIGEIAPPLGQWCKVVAVFAPADDDVLNSTALDTEEIVGASLVVEGRWRAGGDPREKPKSWQDFTWRTDAARAIEMKAVDPRTGDSPIALTSPGDSVMLLVDKTVGPETFAVDPTVDDPGLRVLENITETLKVHRFDED